MKEKSKGKGEEEKKPKGILKPAEELVSGEPKPLKMEKKRKNEHISY